MRKAQIENGVVINVAEVDPENIPDFMSSWIDAGPAGPGWLFENGTFTAPPAPPAPVPNLSFAQLLIGLVTEKWITEAEGEAWLAGTLPGAVLLVIDSLPAEQRFIAKARAIRPSEVLRSDPLVAAMSVAAGKTSADLDAFFRTYAGV